MNKTTDREAKLLTAIKDAREWLQTGGEVDGVKFDEQSIIESLDAAIAEATTGANLPEQPPIVIEVRGGVVVDVTGLPPGCRYQVKDWDDETAET